MKHFHLIIILAILLGQWSCQPTARTLGPSPQPNPDSLPEPNAKYTTIQKIPIQGKLMATDHLLNSYVVTTDNEVVKFSPAGKELYRYSHFDLGDIGYIQARDPFNLLILYQESQVAEILDERLDPISSFDLFRSETPRIRVAALSRFPGEVWIYDESNFRLKRLNASGGVVFESVDLSNLLGMENKPITFMLDAGNVLLGEAGGSLYVFDSMGNYINVEDYQVPSGKVQVFPNMYVYLKDGTFLMHNATTGLGRKQRLILPKDMAQALDAELQDNRVMVLQHNQFSILTFEAQ